MRHFYGNLIIRAVATIEENYKHLIGVLSRNSALNVSVIGLQALSPIHAVFQAKSQVDLVTESLIVGLLSFVQSSGIVISNVLVGCASNRIVVLIHAQFILEIKLSFAHGLEVSFPCKS